LSDENKKFVLEDSYQSFVSAHFKIFSDNNIGPDIKSVVAQEYDRVIKNRIAILVDKGKKEWIKKDIAGAIAAKENYDRIKQELVVKGLTSEEADNAIRDYVNGKL